MTSVNSPIDKIVIAPSEHGPKGARHIKLRNNIGNRSVTQINANKNSNLKYPSSSGIINLVKPNSLNKNNQINQDAYLNCDIGNRSSISIHFNQKTENESKNIKAFDNSSALLKLNDPISIYQNQHLNGKGIDFNYDDEKIGEKIEEKKYKPPCKKYAFDKGESNRRIERDSKYINKKSDLVSGNVNNLSCYYERELKLPQDNFVGPSNIKGVKNKKIKFLSNDKVKDRKITLMLEKCDDIISLSEQNLGNKKIKKSFTFSLTKKIIILKESLKKMKKATNVESDKDLKVRIKDLKVRMKAPKMSMNEGGMNVRDLKSFTDLFEYLQDICDTKTDSKYRQIIKTTRSSGDFKLFYDRDERYLSVDTTRANGLNLTGAADLRHADQELGKICIVRLIQKELINPNSFLFNNFKITDRLLCMLSKTKVRIKDIVGLTGLQENYELFKKQNKGRKIELSDGVVLETNVEFKKNGIEHYRRKSAKKALKIERLLDSDYLCKRSIENLRGHNIHGLLVTRKRLPCVVSMFGSDKRITNMKEVVKEIKESFSISKMDKKVLVLDVKTLSLKVEDLKKSNKEQKVMALLASVQLNKIFSSNLQEMKISKKVAAKYSQALNHKIIEPKNLVKIFSRYGYGM